MGSIQHRPRITTICARIGVTLLLVLAGCGDHSQHAVPWADQLRIAQAQAAAIDPRAALADISILSLDTEQALALGSVQVVLSFNTTPTEAFDLTYESGAPAATIRRWTTSRGELPAVLTDTILAAVQRSPADAIATTWEAGRRYQTELGVTEGYQNVLVYLVSDPARMPAPVTATATYEVIYQAYDRPRRALHQRSFWVDTTTGTVLTQTDATRP